MNKFRPHTPAPMHSTLVVYIELAKHLLAKESNGTSNPYPMVEYRDHSWQGKMVEDDLHPVFRQTCEIPISGDPSQDHHDITVSLWSDELHHKGDKKKAKDPKFLGQVILKIDRLPHFPSDRKPGTSRVTSPTHH